MMMICTNYKNRRATRSIVLYIPLVTVCVVAATTMFPVSGFHLSFGHRLTKSNPQLNPASSLIRPIECRNVNNHSETGICMFAIDCMQNKGTPLSVCKHNYFVGTCCRLPDYNNFVGIVYDLRDTETGVLLEARKTPTPVALPGTQPTVSPPLGSTTELPVAQQTTDEKQKLENRYIISSTSLFPAASSSTTPPTTAAPSVQPAPAVAGESARNVDGLAPASLPANPIAAARFPQQQPTVVSSDMDGAFQIHQMGAPISSDKVKSDVHSGPQSAYEIIGSVEPATNKPTVVPTSSTNSGQQQQFSMSISSQPEQSGESAKNSVYLLGDAESAKQQANIVFANNHQLQSTSHRPPPQPSTVTASIQQSASSGDQDFTVGSPTASAAPATVTSTTTTTTTTPTTSLAPASKLNQTATDSVVEKPTTVQAAQSPFVDLVSSSHLSSSVATVQTTTPFTSSLSTALLPNVSSHPYSPTEPPPQASSLVPAQTFSSSSSSSSSSSLASTPQPTKPSSEAFSQLYSNQHSSSTQALHSYSSESDGSQHHYTARPSGLYPATKIVAASTATNANQLIPSLSGLQSAILSHIPFKIASGLSSGLSSYLQAAMKPSGAGGRPLLSSNTAPALQYQQQMQQAAANSTASRPSTTSAPPSLASSVAAQLVGAVRFPGAGSTSTPEPALQQSTGSDGTSQPAAAPSHADVVREAQLVCGRPQVDQTNNKKRVARIVGGNQSAFGQWPWMVSLRQWRKGLFLHKCGAALLNENWAITAAHCVENVKASDLLLRLGEFDVSNQEEPYPFAERRVKSVVSHPSFDPKTFEYDLALLRFAEPVKFERNIVPVCVPSGNDSYVDRMATVIGWGRLYEDGPLPDVIQHVDVPIITNNECERMYKNAGYIEEIPDMFICAGISKGGRDSCEGDSGGPLTMVDHDGRSYLVGIISWGIGCALPSQPGVYTRITAFSKWINQITAF